MALVGTALLAGDDVRAGCLLRPGSAAECPGIGPLRFGYGSTGTVPAIDPEAVNPGGVAVAPLGAALVVTGAVWIVGTGFLGEPRVPPWLELSVETAAGELAYRLTAALTP